MNLDFHFTQAKRPACVACFKPPAFIQDNNHKKKERGRKELLKDPSLVLFQFWFTGSGVIVLEEKTVFQKQDEHRRKCKHSQLSKRKPEQCAGSAKAQQHR